MRVPRKTLGTLLALAAVGCGGGGGDPTFSPERQTASQVLERCVSPELRSLSDLLRLMRAAGGPMRGERGVSVALERGERPGEASVVVTHAVDEDWQGLHRLVGTLQVADGDGRPMDGVRLEEIGAGDVRGMLELVESGKLGGSWQILLEGTVERAWTRAEAELACRDARRALDEGIVAFQRASVEWKRARAALEEQKAAGDDAEALALAGKRVAAAERAYAVAKSTWSKAEQAYEACREQAYAEASAAGACAAAETERAEADAARVAAAIGTAEAEELLVKTRILVKRGILRAEELDRALEARDVAKARQGRAGERLARAEEALAACREAGPGWTEIGSFALTATLRDGRRTALDGSGLLTPDGTCMLTFEVAQEGRPAGGAFPTGVATMVLAPDGAAERVSCTLDGEGGARVFLRDQYHRIDLRDGSIEEALRPIERPIERPLRR